MATTLKLEITTPTGVVFSGDVEHVRAPGVKGSFGVLPGHTPFVTSLEIGVIHATEGGKETLFATSGGVCEVQEGRVVILAETAEAQTKIDVERAGAAKKRAEDRIASKNGNIDYERARTALMRALNRIHVVKGGV